MTAFVVAWFRPTRAQLDAGARWLRCDLIAYGGRTKLAPIPDQPTATPLRDSIRSCLTSGRGFRTTCSRPHAWRATGVAKVRLAGYPGDQRMRQIAIQRCRDEVRQGKPYWFRWQVVDTNRWLITCYSPR